MSRRFIPGFATVLLLCAPAASRAEEVTIGDTLGLHSSVGWDSFGRWVRTLEKTLRNEVADAGAVIVGSLTNPRTNPAGDDKSAVADLKVQAVLKNHALVKDRKVLHLPHFINVDDLKKPQDYLIFIDVYKGKLDPYRAVVLQSDASLKYLQDARKLDLKKSRDALLFFERHLNSSDPEVNHDAYKELLNLPYADLRAVDRPLPADLIAARLEKGSVEWQRSLDAFLLGHCGNDRHASLLEKQIKAALKADSTLGFHGMLVGFTLLRPNDGLQILRSILSNSKYSFNNRYAALRALRVFRDFRRDVLSLTDIVNAVSLLLDQPDIADLAVEELRRHREVGLMARILALEERAGYEAPIHRRAILRYALTFKGNPAADRFICKMRVTDPELAENVEELLKAEHEAKMNTGK